MTHSRVTEKVSEAADMRIIIESIGTAGASIMKPLELVSTARGAELARLVYCAPSELIRNLSIEKARNLLGILEKAGLKVKVISNDEDFEPGTGQFEVALAVQEPASMNTIAAAVVDVLGVKIEKAQKILCASPALLMGGISENTVSALRQRFEQLGAQLDVSCLDKALYDVFIGECSPAHREKCTRALCDCGIPGMDNSSYGASQPMIAQGLNREQAQALWKKMGRAGVPVTIVHRDFQRFDLSLDSAPDNENMIQYLVSTTGMPESIAHKVIQKTPVILHQNIDFQKMTEHMEEISRLGGSATGHLLAFRSFSLIIERTGNIAASSQLLRTIGGLGEIESLKILKSCGKVQGPLTAPQARWLQWELKRAETETRIVSR